MIPPVIVLDTGPLSNAVVQFAAEGNAPSLSQQCRQWLSDCEIAGATLIVPAIAYYEAMREIERRKATAQRARLSAFSFLLPDRYIPLTTAHLEAAARLWGSARNSGRSTASDDALDGDVILAAQVLSLGLPEASYVVATTNPGHLSRLVSCDLWTNIKP